MRILIFFSISLICLPFATANAGSDVKNSIVHVYTTANAHDYTQPWKMKGQESYTGSGAVITGHRILTNAHVVADQTFIQVRRAGQAKKFVAAVEAVSHAQDLAILTVADKAFFADTRPLDIGSLPRPGETVVTYGFPEGGTRVTVTEGVLSRIDHVEYGHSGIPNLACQIDAAINGGSSGGPVVSNGKIVGLAFQSDEEGENIGYMIPAPVIQHFLTDLEDGQYDGVPDLPFFYQDMDNRELRASFGMTDTQTGVLIMDVPDFLRRPDQLQPNDIVTSIAGFPIANDGTIEFRKGERVVFDYAIEQKQLGESITLSLLRDRQSKDVTLRLEFAKNADNYLVPRYQYNIAPQYYVVGGLVFVPLTLNYLEAKLEELPIGVFRYFEDGYQAKTGRQPQVVILADVLSDEINSGYDYYVDDVVREVNGQQIASMADLVAAFEGNKDDDYHRIVLGRPEYLPSLIVLSVAQTRARGQEILRKYQIQSAASTDLLDRFSKVAAED